jgi:hypothetical protein
MTYIESMLLACLILVAMRALRTADKHRELVERVEQLEAIITADIADEDMIAGFGRDYWPDDEEDSHRC